MYTILETRPEDERFELFLSIPSQVYPYYKRQLSQKNQINPEFLVSCLVLLRDGLPIGRLAIYDNPHLSYSSQRVGAIGNYECIDDSEAAQVLLNRAMDRIRELGMDYLIGPFNGSTWDDYSFITGHSHPNFFLESFNPIYYNQQFLDFGFQAITTRVSGIDRDLSGRRESLEEKERKMQEAGVQIRTICLERYEEELRSLYAFVMKHFRGHDFFSPISWESFRKKYMDLKAWIDPDLVLIAEDEEGKMVGMFFCIQDFLNLDIQCLIAKLAARSPEEKWRGLGDVMMNRMYERARKKGFQAMIHAFMNRGFRSRLSEEYAGEIYKTYALYGMAVPEAVKPSQFLVRNG